MTMRDILHVYPTKREMSLAVASRVAELAEQAAGKRLRFIVALSGGSLLDILSPPLVKNPLGASVDWSAWEVFWVDERCVPLTSPESNFAAAERLLFKNVNIPRNQIHAVDTSQGPRAAARSYQATIRDVLQPAAGRLPRFDLILLGMGEDGHTASLFPGDALLQEKRKWVAPVMNAPKRPLERITLTLPIINNAREVIFVVSGEGKAARLREVFHAPDHGQGPPAALVSPTDGTLKWFVDSSAAGQLMPLPEES